MRLDWEVLVIGAGPAGSLAASLLAERGHDVLLVDRKRFPRVKVCGGCLNAHAVASLRRAGLDDVLRRLPSAPIERLALRAQRREMALPLAGGLAIDRSRLDSELADRAVRSGAVFLDGTRAQVEPVQGGQRSVRLLDESGERLVRARLVVAADGLGSASLGRAAAARPSSRFGAGAILPAPERGWAAHAIHMSVARGGYVGAVRLDDGRLNVAAAWDAAFLKEAGSPAEAARRLLRDAGAAELPDHPDEGWVGTPALTRSPARPAAEHLFAIGDASGYVEPFTGEGMAWALADALSLAPWVERALEGWSAELESGWAKRHRERTRRARWRCLAIARLLRSPRLLSATMALATPWPGLLQSVAARVHGEAAEA